MYMMQNMVAIVKSHRVSYALDRVEREPIIAVPTLGVNKKVLREISKHKHEGDEKPWEYEEPETADRVGGENYTKYERTIQHNTTEKFSCDVQSILFIAVIGQFDIDTELKPQIVVQEMQKVVALVRHGGGEIVRHNVVFLVVHDNMMGVITKRR